MSIRSCALSVLVFAVACSAPPAVDPGKDETAPRVLAIIPADGATSVARNAAITVVFSEPVDGIAEGVTVEGASGAFVADADKLVATFNPAANYAAGATLTVHVASTVRDAAGNAAVEKTSTFTVATDDAAPTVTSTTPAHGATNVSVASPISVVLSEPLLDSSVTASAIEVDGVVGTVTYAAAENTVTLTPGAALPHGVQLVATAKGVKDLAGNELAPFRWSFTTAQETTAPTVSSVTPANGAANVPVNSAVTVVFSEPMDPLTITPANLQLGNVALAVSYDASSRTATITPVLPLSPASSVTLQIGTGVKDVAGNALAQPFTSSFTTAADTTAPTILSRLPAPNAMGVSTAGSVVVTFSEPMDSTTLTATSFGITGVSGTVSYDGNARAAIFSPAQPLAEGAMYSAFVTSAAKDVAGNPVADATWTFTTTADTTGPSVIWSSPGANATQTQVSAPVRVMFSEPIAAASLTAASLSVANGSAAIPGTLSFDAITRTATFTPNAPLPYSTVITVTVTTAITDVAGNALTQAATFTFTTEADLVPPVVISTTPADNSVDAGTVSPVITIRFSEPLDPSTVAGAVQLTVGGSPESGTTSWDSANNAIVFTRPLLGYLTNYTVTVASSVKDLAGNPMRGAYSFSFTTEADSTPPTLVSSIPANGATNVSINPTITLNFSELMKGSTIQAITLNGAPVFSFFNPDNSYFTANPPLDPSTTYTLTIPTQVTDANGVPFASPVSITFTTEPDPTPPQVIAVSPLSGTRMVSTTAPPAITVDFDEKIDPTTINSTNLAVTGATGTWSLIGTSQRSVMFNPALPLPSSSKITITISGVKDLAGNVMAAPVQSSFDTASTPALLPTAPGDAYTTDAKVAFASATSGAAVWVVDNGTSRKLVYARYTGGAWQTSAVLDSCVESRSLEPELLAAGTNGFAVAYFPCNDPSALTHHIAVFDGGVITKRALTSRVRTLVSAGTSYAALHGLTTAQVDVFDGSTSQWSTKTTTWSYPSLASNGAGFAVVAATSSSVEGLSWSAGTWGPLETIATVPTGSNVTDLRLLGGSGTFVAMFASKDPQVAGMALLRLARHDGSGWLSASTVTVDNNQPFEIRAATVSSSGAYLFITGRTGVAGLTAHHLSGSSLTTTSVTAASASGVEVALEGSSAVVLWYGSGGNLTVLGGTGTSWNASLSLLNTYRLSLVPRSNDIVLYRSLNNAPTADTRSYSGAGWSPPVSSPVKTDTFEPLVRRGTTVVGLLTSTSHVFENTWTGTTWASPVQLDTTSFPSSPLAINSAQVGTRTLVTWQQSTNPAASSSAPNLGYAFASVFDGNSWSTPVSLSTAPVDAVKIATNPSGTRAIVGWLEGNPLRINVRTYDATTGTWSAAAQTPVGGVQRFNVGHDGTQFIVHGGNTQSPAGLYEATSADGVTWSSATNLTASSTSDYLFVDSIVSGSRRAFLSRRTPTPFLHVFFAGAWSTENQRSSVGFDGWSLTGNGAGEILAYLGGGKVETFNGTAWVQHSSLAQCTDPQLSFVAGSYLAACPATFSSPNPQIKRYGPSGWQQEPLYVSSVRALVPAAVGTSSPQLAFAHATTANLSVTTPLGGVPSLGGAIDEGPNLFEPRFMGGSEFRLVWTKPDASTGARRLWFSRGN